MSKGGAAVPSNTNKKQQILAYIQENPFVTQQELADKLALSRSAVASYISALTQSGEIIGRAYVLSVEKRVTCIGGANVDRKIQSLAPLEYGTSNPAVVHEAHGGVARNIAENLGRLGVKPNLITMVGHDKQGEELLSHCSQVGIEVAYIIRSDTRNTGTYTAVLDVGGEMAVALADMAIYDEFSISRIDQRWHAIAASTMIVLDTNLPAETLAHVLTRAHRENLQVCVAPVSSPKAKRLPSDLNGVSLLIANLDETAAITGLAVETLDDMWAAGATLLSRGCEQVVITRGSKGCAFLQRGGVKGTVTAEPVEVADVTGAGDAFVAGVVYALGEGRDLEAACRFGTRLSQVTLRTKYTVSRGISPDVAAHWLDEIQTDIKKEHE
jgi:pseudouridine kinase